MIYRQLGRTGLNVSVLGCGGHTYPVGDGPDDFCTPEERARLIRHLVSAGVNYFDTTWKNEVELLADSLRRAEIREPLHVSMQFVDGISDPQWREKLRGEVESRLEIMGYSQAPLFIMGVGNHRPPLTEIAAACQALQALKQAGLVRNVGVSCHDLDAFAALAEIIEQDDPLDYVMIRYNWKFPQASERLFHAIRERNVGLVVMKVFCWDCGPDNWGRRISIFDPVTAEERVGRTTELNAAQRSLRWCLETAPCATTVPSINAFWEADQLIQAVQADTAAEMGDFGGWRDRLYDRARLAELAQRAESAITRKRASEVLAQLA